MFTHAITRLPGPDFAQGLTTSGDLGAPDYGLILQQHTDYCAALKWVGIEIITLDVLVGYPDAYFVEDVAVVTPDVAVITRPGADARRGEAPHIEPMLAQYRPIVRIESPGTVDGGDVLMVGTHFFIGVSERTNQSGAEQLGRILESHGNTWDAIPVGAGLHLKSSVNFIGKNTLLLTAEFSTFEQFSKYSKIILDEDEVYAGNTLLINKHLLTPKGFPKTKAKLESLGLPIIELDVSEVQKMDGGLTCMSLRF